MTVNISKPALNLREKLAELDKPSGIAGEAVLRADTTAEAREAVELSNVADSATGVDVSGAATMDGLTVDGGATTTLRAGGFTSNSETVLELAENRSGVGNDMHYGFRLKNDGAGDNNFHLTRHNNSTTGNKALSVGRDTGDISFYEDTGTTPKFHWDASAESLGIGTSSPDRPLSVVGGNSMAARFQTLGSSSFIQFSNTGSTADQVRIGSTGTNLVLSTNYAERMRIDSSGNVGIGCSPNARFSIGISGTQTAPVFILGNDADTGLFRPADNSLAVTTAGSERMRIDSSGNVLVGKTSVSLGTVGVEVKPFGEVRATASGAQALQLNRLSTDGTIADFRKDGTTVGSIQSRAGVVTTLVLNPASGNGAGLSGGTKAVVPADEAGIIDNDISLGVSSHRFKDLHLSGGVYLGGTGSANKLDDYEEGTWTLVITGESGGSVSTGTGYYRKVGRQVYCAAYINQTMDLSAISGLINFSLPFTGSSWHGGGTVVYATNFFTGTAEPDTAIMTRTLGARARLVKGSSTAWITSSHVELASGSKAFMFEHNYIV